MEGPPITPITPEEARAIRLPWLPWKRREAAREIATRLVVGTQIKPDPSIYRVNGLNDLLQIIEQREYWDRHNLQVGWDSTPQNEDQELINGE